jgi:hypothetical protein
MSFCGAMLARGGEEGDGRDDCDVNRLIFWLIPNRLGPKWTLFIPFSYFSSTKDQVSSRMTLRR